MHRPPTPALLRSRFRVLFFLSLVLAACATGRSLAAAPALLGLAVALVSVGVARLRGHRLAHTFVVLDWLLLGCCLALAGGVHSWLLAAVPLLAAGHLNVSPRHEWPYLLMSASVLLVVLAIADPGLGGNRLAGVAIVVSLIGGGTLAAHRLAVQRRRHVRQARIDAVTGFYAADRLPEVARVRLELAAADNTALSLVYLRPQPCDTGRSGGRTSEALVKGVARRLQQRLSPGDLAFRLPHDAFVLLLPGRSENEARQLARAAAEDVAANLMAGRRPTVAFGCASFPAVRSPRELLALAREEARSASLPPAPPAQAVELATAL